MANKKIIGSGKTLCYVLPILNHLLSPKNKKENLAGAVVLAPSKELCSQIYSVFRKYDPTNKLRICRAGPITQKAPVIKYQV